MLFDALAVAPAWRNNKHRWLWVPDQRSLCSLVRDDEDEVASIFKQPINHKPAFSRHEAPEVLQEPFAQEIEGAGNAGAQCTRSLACEINKAHERSHHRFTGVDPAFPAQWFYGLLRALPGDQACLTPSPALLLADLTPASGRQNDTTSPYASTSFVRLAIARLTLPRPPHPAPNVRDDREAPLLWARDGEGYASDLGQAKTKIFLISGLDTISENPK
jgi:hypothetical protein